MASASEGTSETALPAPTRAPPGGRILPGMTITELAPIFSMDCRMEVLEPLPISIIVITAAIPMMMPNIVSMVRVGLRLSDISDILIVVVVRIFYAPLDLNAPEIT